MNLLVVFILLNIVNVIVQTIKSIVTVKGNKWTASIANALAYGFYTVVVVYMLCDLPLYLKALTVAVCNLIGVFVVKLIEEKKRKDKLWKIEVSILNEQSNQLSAELDLLNIPYDCYSTGERIVFNIFAASQRESALIHELIDRFNAKYFITESKDF